MGKGGDAGDEMHNPHTLLDSPRLWANFLMPVGRESVPIIEIHQYRSTELRNWSMEIRI